MKLVITQSETSQIAGGFENIVLENQSGMSVTLSQVGAGIRSIKVPTFDGTIKEMTFCPDDDENYPIYYHGKTIGRNSGRLKGATYQLNGRVALLEKNNFGQDNLHGGKKSFNTKKFSYEVEEEKSYTDVIFKYFSPDLENGFIGNINLKVTYRVYEKENTIDIFIDGTTDDVSFMNITNHAFFNLSGNLESPITEQELFINASKYARIGKTLLLEKIENVSKEFDFRKAHKIGDFVYSKPLQDVTQGYDHPFFLDQSGMDVLAASLYSRDSKVKLEVRTTYPCAVIFSPTFAFNDVPSKYSKVRTCCIECQFFPDAIHEFKERNGVFTKENPYHEQIQFKFSLEK